ncbi:hypothetical protein [Streptomyces sp. NPDC059009]|uniref:hypothetical protein n=1 Tax=Streptomyces sp. NPDC059009 TaxID=3346694 RepID=UPI00369531CC
MRKIKAMTFAGTGIAALGLSLFGAAAANAAPEGKADHPNVRVVNQKTGKQVSPEQLAKETGGKVTVTVGNKDKSSKARHHGKKPGVQVVDQKTGKRVSPEQVAKETGGKVTVTVGDKDLSTRHGR